MDGDEPLFAVRADRDLRAERWADLREIGAVLGDRDAGLLTSAVALARWHDRHPRCSICGAPTDLERAGWSRRCPVDGSEHFPRTDPAVIMLVHDGGDRCVLGRQATWPPGRYSILAGFVEPGESAEAAVAREVQEEVGLAVSDVQYTGSQPWPFPASLMLGFTALAVGDPALHLNDGELADARWVTRAQLRSGEFRLPPPVSIAHLILSTWLDAG
jgi:NAD+ diphosphatase